MGTAFTSPLLGKIVDSCGPFLLRHDAEEWDCLAQEVPFHAKLSYAWLKYYFIGNMATTNKHCIVTAAEGLQSGSIQC